MAPTIAHTTAPVTRAPATSESISNIEISSPLAMPLVASPELESSKTTKPPSNKVFWNLKLNFDYF